MGILFLGSWTRNSPYLPHVDSVASSFRILVTFAIVLEVRGTSFFQLPWTILGKSSFEPKGHDQSALDEFSFLYCESASSTLFAWVIRKKCWASLDILIYASRTQKNICSFELSLFSCILTSVYQVIVRNSCAIVFVSVYYSCGPSSHSISEWLGETNSSTSSISRIGLKQLYSADQNANPAFDFVLPWSIALLMSGMSWELHQLLWILDAVILLAIIICPSVPCCCNRNTDKWTVMCEINTPSNLVAW